MLIVFKKLFHSILFNTSLFLVLITSIQNTNKKNKVDFLFNETIELPISFIIGISFITGSLAGNLITFPNNGKNEKKF